VEAPTYRRASEQASTADCADGAQAALAGALTVKVLYQREVFKVSRQPLFVATFTLILSQIPAFGQPAAVNRWTPLGTTGAARSGACAVTLPGGETLLAGGQAANGDVASVELYDASGAAAKAAPLMEGRSQAVCAALPDGRIGVWGGNGTAAVHSSETFNPATGTWSRGSGAPVRRAGDATATMADGRILLAGGLDRGRASRQIDIFDPVTNSVTAGGVLLTARSHAAATPLLDGTILITGGIGEAGTPISSTEIYNPRMKVSAAAGNLQTARAEHSAVLLTDNGQVLIAGGRNRGGAIAGSELYNPLTGAFSTASPLSSARYSAAALIPRSGTVLLTGGQDASGAIGSTEAFGYATLRGAGHAGKPVTISGEGWLANAQVQVHVRTQGNAIFTTTTTADGSGNVSLNLEGSVSSGADAVDATDGVSTAVFPLAPPPKGPVPIVSANLTANSPVNGNTSVFSVTVLGAAGLAAPSGSVTFSAGSLTTVPTALTPTDITCVSSCTSTASGSLLLAAGSYTVQVNYQGDANYTPFSPAATLPGFVVAAAPTSLTLSSSAPGGAQAGSPVTFTATLSTPGLPLGLAGTVTFLSDGGAIASCSATNVAGVGVVACTTSALPVSVAAHNITATFTPANGNYSGSSAQLQQVVTPFPSTASVISSSPNPSFYGQTVTYTVRVTGTGAITPTGTVTLLINGTPLSFVTAISGAGNTATATIPVQPSTTQPGPLLAGSNSVSVTYSGDANYAASNGGGATQVVNALGTTTTVSPAPLNAVYGQFLTFTATTTVNAPATAPLPNGNITFADGGTVLSMVGLSTSANYSTSSLTVGRHSITAAYQAPNAGFTSSTSTASTVTVAKASTNIVLTTIAPYTLVATVMVNAPGGGVPTGTIAFLRNGTQNIGYAQLAPVAATGNQFTATFMLTPSQLGAYTAIYSGDGNFVGSTSALVALNGPALGLAGVTVSGTPTIVNAGQQTLLQAFVQATFSGPAPTGTVQFLDGTKDLGTVNLQGTVATMPQTFSTGSHTITAIYSGDLVYAPAKATCGVVVNWLASSISVASTGTPVYGQTATFKVTLSGSNSNMPAPTGKVQLLDAGQAIGNPLNAAGSVNITVGGLNAGVHQITATYTGDAVWEATHSAAISQTVNQAPSSTTLNAVPSLLPNQIVLTSKVSSTVGVPTGSVSFVDGTSKAVLGSASLASGVATVTVPVGNNSVIAIYSGDSNFLGSASNGFLEASAGNAASFTGGVFAPGEIVTIKGSNLATSTVSGTFPLQTVLGGVSVAVTDSKGNTTQAQLYYVSPTQVNFVMPAALAAGPATVSISNNLSVLFSLSITVAGEAPGLFTADASGSGALVGVLVDTAADGTSTAKPLSGAINLVSGHTYFLEMFGTGLDNVKLSSVKVTINGQAVPVLFAGPQLQYAGLDQINVGPLPAGLAGSGTVPVVVTVNGTASSPVTVTFQ